MTANPCTDASTYARDLARLPELTGPHLPPPRRADRTRARRHGPADRAETIAILGRLGDPREGATDDDVD